jgi:hypothetical protein
MAFVPDSGRFVPDEEATRADPKIGQPEELTFAEKHIAPLLELAGLRGATKGGAVGRVLKGASDPAVAAAQMVANVLPGEAGASVNKWVADQERGYQADRAIEGSEGVDLLRAGGRILATAPLGAAAGAGVKAGAAIGAAEGALNPVTEGDFWKTKGSDVAIGAAGGAVMSPLLGALARIVSPKASVDPAVKMLRDEGVTPSIGQTLGGWANALEQKATSLPIMGDMIAKARKEGIESFNEAALNRTVAPVGGKISQAGHEGVKEAGDILSGAYDDAAKTVGHINFATPKVMGSLEQLEDMVRQGLSPDMAKKFEGIAERTILRRMSPNGSIVGADLKKVDGELGQIAAEWRKSTNPADREFGAAVRQLQQVFRDGMADASPEYAAARAAADQGWAMLKRTRGAARAAKNEEGIFTPAQLNRQAESFDNTVGKRATAEGSALMQDLARAGQRLGTKIPDSGTAGRLMAGAAAIASGGLHLGIPAALGAGAAMYSKPMQNILREIVLRRPDMAPAVANYLRQLSTPAALAGSAGVGVLSDR